MSAKAKRDRRTAAERYLDEVVDYLGRVRTTKGDVDLYLRQHHGLQEPHIAFLMMGQLPALDAEPLVAWNTDAGRWESLVPGWIFDDETLLWSEVPVHLTSELDPAGVECGLPGPYLDVEDEGTCRECLRILAARRREIMVRYQVELFPYEAVEVAA